MGKDILGIRTQAHRIVYTNHIPSAEKGTFQPIEQILLFLLLLDDNKIKIGKEVREETKGKSGKVDWGRYNMKKKYKRRVSRR